MFIRETRGSRLKKKTPEGGYAAIRGGGGLVWQERSEFFYRVVPGIVERNLGVQELHVVTFFL